MLHMMSGCPIDSFGVCKTSTFASEDLLLALLAEAHSELLALFQRYILLQVDLLYIG